MGTHNHLLRLGDTLFLEIIAPDPATGPLSRRRWFALDDPKLRAELAISPRLVTWVVATDDIETALREVPHAAGPAVTVDARRSGMADVGVPDDGSMPFGGAFPTLIQRPRRGPHPASGMPDLGCSLVSFEIAHPDAELIGRSLQAILRRSARAVFARPQGRRSPPRSGRRMASGNCGEDGRGRVRYPFEIMAFLEALFY